MQRDLTKGSETKALIAFAAPMILGNIFQQLYNVVDTIIVGKFIGPYALAAVGSSYTLMVFTTSIILGLCIGSGVVFSYYFGSKDVNKLRSSFFTSFIFIFVITLFINILAIFFIDVILNFINIPQDVYLDTKEYILIIFYGIVFMFIYNYFSAVLRSIGNSIMPLIFLIIAALTNIVLDILFVVSFNMGVKGAAIATIIAQGVSAFTITIYSFLKVPELRINSSLFKLDKEIAKLIVNNSLLSSIQQSVMNFGILMVQGLINSFGVTVMAAFAAAVKIDNFAYMPMQELGNAFSTYVAQNQGAKKYKRVKKGIKAMFKMITLICMVISFIVIIFSRNLMMIFVNANEISVIDTGVKYLYVVGIFYCLVGYLFMFYGLYRGMYKTQMSVILTLISLGTRVSLAYALSSIEKIGLIGIWWSIPIGWFLADLVDVVYYKYLEKNNKVVK